MTSRSIAAVLLLWGLACGTPSAVAQETGFTDRFCVEPPFGELCPTLPFDQADFSSSFEYMLLVAGAQDPFDVFAWQAFVALNWPADAAGAPLPAALGEAEGTPRVWQGFPRRDTVFPPDPAAAACGEGVPPSALLIDELAQADGTVLIDRDLSFAVYDTRMNAVAADYIRANGLQSLAGQAAFGRDREISFPRGHLPDVPGDGSGLRPSVLIKTAWRILGDDADAGRFLLRDGVIHVPARRSASGRELCLPVRLGLVGMHIVLRTFSGHGDEWIWATFEQVDNVPLAGNARNVNSIYSWDLFPGGCAPPPPPSGRYSFFDPACEDCTPNTPQPGDWSWSDKAPFARLAGRPVLRGSQVVRCWEIFESTAEVNRLWQLKLAGTPWSHYMLVSTQWRGAPNHPMFEHGEVPRYLTNTTMETFLQDNPKGTCLGCHGEATTPTGRPSNFTFLLRRAE